jgi:hypothetical protein
VAYAIADELPDSLWPELTADIDAFADADASVAIGGLPSAPTAAVADMSADGSGILGHRGLGVASIAARLGEGRADGLQAKQSG